MPSPIHVRQSQPRHTIDDSGYIYSYDATNACHNECRQSMVPTPDCIISILYHISAPHSAREETPLDVASPSSQGSSHNWVDFPAILCLNSPAPVESTRIRPCLIDVCPAVSRRLNSRRFLLLTSYSSNFRIYLSYSILQQYLPKSFQIRRRSVLPTQVRELMRTQAYTEAQQGRFVVALSLQEAENLRGCLHLAGKSTGLVKERPTTAALRLTDGTCLDASWG